MPAPTRASSSGGLRADTSGMDQDPERRRAAVEAALRAHPWRALTGPRLAAVACQALQAEADHCDLLVEFLALHPRWSSLTLAALSRHLVDALASWESHRQWLELELSWLT